MAARRGAWWLPAALAVGLCGCDGQDADRLTRLGRKAVDKLHSQTGGSPGEPGGPLQSIRGNLNDIALDAKVAARLRWDRDLEGAEVQVVARGSAVELRGSVADLRQRQRAVDLARSTVGVTEVIDRLIEAGEGR
jgi:osmotically-inducible protein OsmY